MLLGTTVEAQDIAQEAALQAFLGLSPAGACAFCRLVSAIAANLARSALRRRSEHSFEQLGQEAMRDLLWVDPSSTVEEYRSEAIFRRPLRWHSRTFLLRIAKR